MIFKIVGIRRGFNDIKSLRSPPTTTSRARMSILTIKDLTKTNLAGVRELNTILLLNMNFSRTNFLRYLKSRTQEKEKDMVDALEGLRGFLL